MDTQAQPELSVQAQLAALARRYCEQLPSKFDEIDAGWRALRAAWSQEAAESLHRTAHSMAGAAGTMGLPQVGDAARVVEQRVKQLLGEPSRLSDMAAEITGAIETLALAVQGGEPRSPAAAPSHAELEALPPLRILVAEDEPMGRQVLCTLLEAWGHTVFSAEDGEEALVLFQREAPDMVLMDVVMPRMNGYDAAHAIKQACGSRFVPLIFLTALQDENDLAQCVAAGGDDFMVKPYNGVLLQAKLIAMNRIRELHRELAHYQQKTQEEIALSRYVFEAVTDRNSKTSAVTHWHSAVGHFSGDLLLYAYTPGGRLIVLQGDFTGHGLAAALGALPLSDVFYELVADEVSVPDLALTLNRKLKSTLPLGHFCAACILALDSATLQMEVWNGGLPGVWVVQADGVANALASSKLPLGIVGDAGFDVGVERVALQPGQRILLFSDGLSEATNAAGEMLGEERVAAMLGGSANDAVAALRAGVEAHLAGCEAHDDISIAVIDPAQARNQE